MHQVNELTTHIQELENNKTIPRVTEKIKGRREGMAKIMEGINQIGTKITKYVTSLNLRAGSLIKSTK